jgi:hypothetical protein
VVALVDLQLCASVCVVQVHPHVFATSSKPAAAAAAAAAADSEHDVSQVITALSLHGGTSRTHTLSVGRNCEKQANNALLHT